MSNTRIYLTSFYSIVIYAFYKRFVLLYDKDYQNVTFDFPVNFLNYIPYPLNAFLTVAIGFALTSIIVYTALKPTKWPRRLAMMSIIAFFSLLYQARVNHSFHAVFISILVFGFFKDEEELHSKHNMNIMITAQVLILAQYFFAGLWKLKSIVEYTLSGNSVVQGTLEQLVKVLLYEDGPADWFVQLVFQYPTLYGLSWLTVVTFQLSTIYPIITKKYFKFWGIGLMIFHFGAGSVTGVWFTNTILGLVFFFIYTEQVKSKKIT